MKFRRESGGRVFSSEGFPTHVFEDRLSLCLTARVSDGIAGGVVLPMIRHIAILGFTDAMGVGALFVWGT